MVKRAFIIKDNEMRLFIAAVLWGVLGNILGSYIWQSGDMTEEQSWIGLVAFFTIILLILIYFVKFNKKIEEQKKK
jgi:membrane protein DedA with SNARE-associated domain